MAQYCGAFLGASVVFLTYFEAFEVYGNYTNETSVVFATYPEEHLSTGGGFVDQVCVHYQLLFYINT